jgi:fibro-slime domain-containing protein
VTTYLRRVEARVGAAGGLLFTLSACGAKTDLHHDPQLGLERLPECTEEGATRPCESICGEGKETCYEGKWRFCSASEPRPPTLDAVVRDFSSSHPDFEPDREGFDPGIVASELSVDDKPVWAGGTIGTTTSEGYFETWYRENPIYNESVALEIQLLPSARDPDLYQYESSAFFPIDGRALGNENYAHNYHFTLEVKTAFRYEGGEVFSFTGDDDLWVFINRRLAIDLGGVHPSMSASVELDDDARELGLVRGEVYPLHLFFAERHVYGSNFNVHTTIAEFELCE